MLLFLTIDYQVRLVPLLLLWVDKLLPFWAQLQLNAQGGLLQNTMYSNLPYSHLSGKCDQYL